MYTFGICATVSHFDVYLRRCISPSSEILAYKTTFQHQTQVLHCGHFIIPEQVKCAESHGQSKTL